LRLVVAGAAAPPPPDLEEEGEGWGRRWRSPDRRDAGRALDTGGVSGEVGEWRREMAGEIERGRRCRRGAETERELTCGLWFVQCSILSLE
jgi:hypothetical protein